MRAATPRRRAFPTLGIVLLMASAPAAADLMALFVPLSRMAPGWDVVEEAAGNPGADPELRGLGIRDMRARHYTRARGPASEVCSVEIWAFDAPASAERAAVAFAPPGWRVQRSGRLLVLLRAVTHQRRRGFRKGLFPACEQLGDATLARVAARSRP